MLKSLKKKIVNSYSKTRNSIKRSLKKRRRRRLNRKAEKIEQRYSNQNKNSMTQKNKNTWLEAWKENVFIPFISSPSRGTYTSFLTEYKPELYDTCKISERVFNELMQDAMLIQQKDKPYSKENIDLFTNKFVEIAGMETLMCLGI